MATIAASGDDVQAWLLTEAKVHKRAVGKVVELLEAELVYCVDDLVDFSRLKRFGDCLPALAVERIQAALALRAGRPPRANPDPDPATPTAPRTRASTLTTPPIRRLFSTPEAGPVHYERESAAEPPARLGVVDGTRLCEQAGMTAAGMAVHYTSTVNRNDVVTTRCRRNGVVVGTAT